VALTGYKKLPRELEGTQPWTSSQSGITIGHVFGIKGRQIERLDFIVAGAQKSGTTALHYFLRRHPQIALPDRQELHFFDDEEIFSRQPVDYELLYRHFRKRPVRLLPVRLGLAGEVTPSYLYWKPAMERIWNYNRQIKLVILLRNPIDRAFAHWNMQRFKDREPLDFLTALKEEPRRIVLPLTIESRRFAYVDRGFYSGQLQRVFKFFPREQVHIVKFEDFRDRKQETLDGIFEFLDVKSLRRIRDKDRNIVPYERAMTPEERKYLSEVFSAEITKLEQMLGWDCSDWKGRGGSPEPPAGD
jgi:Sulfotransferase domain